MQAIDFKTVLYNGTVTIPPQFSPQWEGKAIRVIVLADDESEFVVYPAETSESLFSKLKQIKISAPVDFSENIDAYLNEEQNA
jgi:hypothetical protein